MGIVAKQRAGASLEFATSQWEGYLEELPVPPGPGPEPVTPLNDLRAAISAAIDDNLPDPVKHWRRSIFNLARALHGLGDLRARWMQGEQDDFREVVSEFFERGALADHRYSLEVVWDYFESVAMPSVKCPKGQEGARWQGAWNKALLAYLGRKPDALAGSIIREKRYKSPALKLALHFVVELQRDHRPADGRGYEPFRLSSYMLADQLATQLGECSQRYAHKLLFKLVYDDVLVVASRGSAGTQNRRANEYRLAGFPSA